MSFGGAGFARGGPLTFGAPPDERTHWIGAMMPAAGGISVRLWMGAQ